jgi:DNA-binding transcriptional MerR regulator
MGSACDHPLRVGQLAEQSGKTVRAIHFYEELGLLNPIRRTKGGFRLYDQDAVLRIQWIDRLQELGFSLQEIREFLGDLRSAGTGPAAMVRLRGFYAQKLRETRTALARLASLETELDESLRYLEGCRVCAPETTRHACKTCDESLHQGQQPPALVAAVHE